jgi:MSHA biogenesis protein MshO
MTRHLAPRQRGFTLIEAVMVIALTGIVGAMVAVFIRQPINAYVDTARRGEMSDEADGALRRIARELRSALPNSVRVNAAGNRLEFLPVRSAGRYRAAPNASGVGDFLDFTSSTDGSFEVLGPAVSAQAGDQLVVYNLGLTGADAYAGTSRRALTSTGASLASLSYTVGGTQFPYASPNKRFHIVSQPITYACTPLAGGAGSLRRYSGYAIQAAQPTNTGTGSLLGSLSGANNALLSGSVAACSFTYNTTGSAHKAVVTLRLTLTRSGESISLMQQVFVESSP